MSELNNSNEMQVNKSENGKGKGIMNVLSMFDVVTGPVNAVCEWVKAPLKRFEHKRKMQMMDKEADVTIRLQREAAELAAERERQQAELQVEQRRWNAEIDELIADSEMRRNKEMVEAIKQYQLDLSNATKEIVESLGVMSLELRRKANDLLEEKMRSYKAIQDEAKKQSIAEINEAKEMFFEDDPETYRMLVNTALSERKSTFEVAGRFMLELSEDFKRLNQNTDALLQMGMRNVDKYLEPIAGKLGTGQSLQSSYNSSQIEDKNVIDV